MTEDTCPACGGPIEEFERVGPVTFALVPCGHQVDDEVRGELTTRNENSGDTDP